MPEYTLRIRRFDPQSGEAAYWDEHTVELEYFQIDGAMALLIELERIVKP